MSVHSVYVHYYTTQKSALSNILVL